ncbi:MAG: glycoside hydrolase family 38 C-terminal domain-containing protein [Pseudobacter sp.]|uniref:glycoside hydrolase family 38 C-terminal domain-containing protein n=1 Tax=Pseudobacter sp. TaxID=2045420 RepID=UPI003F7FE7AE
MTLGSSFSLFAQQSWFIDGYHGGIWGHYPKGYTSFILDQLNRHPDWKINLEIEPVTWDAVKLEDAAAYASMQALMDTRRVEYVNPAFGQSYLFTGSGESMIRQFSYGMKKLWEHFPGIRFTTYSTEEPCFTSSLPQVLRSFGFSAASLKNPNTCWGGYTRAFGGELVNWIGPDGSSILTVPRYATEALWKTSTWQTAAWNNGRDYLQSALDYGVKHPVGMCLQDAGWHNGPWLGNRTDTSKIQYTTWRNYFEKIADHTLATDWRLSQEDILVSLVWGSQVLQRIAQQIRKAEDKMVATEKLAAIATVRHGFQWPTAAFDRAWESLLLAQHHDCWIVPYNGKRGDTWADKVRNWTAETERICDSISKLARKSLASEKREDAFTIFNTTALDRHELVSIPATENSSFNAVRSGKQILPVQWTTNNSTGKKELLLKAHVAATGMQLLQLTTGKPPKTPGATAVQRNGVVVLETDLYRMVIDPASGGAIKSLISKQWGNKEWIARGNIAFNTLHGNFYNDGGQLSTALQPATVNIIESGPLRVKVAISGRLAGHPLEQTITLVQGEPRIDCSLLINWQKNIAVGDNYKQDGAYRAEEYRKAFYDDRKKLLLSLPLNLEQQVLHKNAPFDVTQSKLENTLFTTWDSIRNNVLLNWVDVADEDFGMALFTDHTTAYVHGKDRPLELVVQYSGKGLWGMNYTVEGPTKLDYSLLPHKKSWDGAGLEAERARLAEPLQVVAGVASSATSLIRLSKQGWELSSITIEGKDMLLRLYNAAAADSAVEVYLPVQPARVILENLNGTAVKSIQTQNTAQGGVLFSVTAPRFGFRTVRLQNLVK